MIVYSAAHQLTLSNPVHSHTWSSYMCCIIACKYSNVVNLNILTLPTRNVFYKYFRAYCQILMSVQQALIHAIKKPCVWTLMEVTHVHVPMDTVEMGELAMVRVSV